MRRRRLLVVVIGVALLLAVLGCDGLFIASWEGGVNPWYTDYARPPAELGR